MKVDHKEVIKSQINTMLAKDNLSFADLRDAQEKLRMLEHLVRDEASNTAAPAAKVQQP